MDFSSRQYSCAHFYNQSPTAPLEELEDLTHIAAQAHDQELVTDLPGRHNNDAGKGTHNYEPKMTPTEAEAIAFAKELAEVLKRGFDSHEFEQLYLVAPAHFMGLIKKELDSKIERLKRKMSLNCLLRRFASVYQSFCPSYSFFLVEG